MFNETFTEGHNKKYHLHKLLSRTLLFIVFVAPPTVVFIGALINRNGPDIKGSTSQTVAGLFVTLFVVLYTWRRMLGSQLKTSLWDEYAKVSGFAKSEDPRTWAMPLAGPVVSDGETAKTINFNLNGFIDKYKVMISSTTFVFNLFKSEVIGDSHLTRYTFRYLILAVDIGVPLPHIFIDGLTQNKFRYSTANMWSLTKRVNAQERLIDLEGDFYKYFKVYAASIYQPEIAALSIVTPDVMLAIRDKGYNFDYEIYNKKLYVIAEDRIMSIDQMNSFFEGARAVTEQLVPQLSKQLHVDTGKKLTINHSRAGWLSAWYSLGIFMFYAVLYFFMVAFCESLAQYFSS